MLAATSFVKAAVVTTLLSILIQKAKVNCRIGAGGRTVIFYTTNSNG